MLGLLSVLSMAVAVFQSELSKNLSPEIEALERSSSKNPAVTLKDKRATEEMTALLPIITLGKWGQFVPDLTVSSHKVALIRCTSLSAGCSRI